MEVVKGSSTIVAQIAPVYCTSPVAFNFYKLCFTFVLGTPIGALGVYLNWTLIKLFLTHESLHSWKIYLLVLAMADLGLCVLYLIMHTVTYLGYHGEIHFLYAFTNRISVFVDMITNIAWCFICFLLLLMALDRLLKITKWNHFLFTWKHKYTRFCILGIVLIVAALPRLPIIFFVKMIYEPECPEFQEYHAEFGTSSTPFLDSVLIFSTMGAYFFSIFTAILLSICVKRSRTNTSDEKWLVVALLISHLFCLGYNILHWFLDSFFGNFYVRIMFDEDFNSTHFFSFSIEFIDFSWMFDSATRFFIYFLFSAKVRSQILEKMAFMRKLWRFSADDDPKESTNTQMEL